MGEATAAEQTDFSTGGVLVDLVGWRVVCIRPHRKKRILKTVQYFLMEIIGGSPENHDHEVTEVLLLDRNEALRRLTFENDREVVRILWYSSQRRPPNFKRSLVALGMLVSLSSLLLIRFRG